MQQLVTRMKNYGGGKYSTGTPEYYADDKPLVRLTQTVNVLRAVIERHAGRMGAPDLRTVAALGDAQIVRHSHDCMTGYETVTETVGEPGLLRQLCRQELVRRGLKA